MSYLNVRPGQILNVFLQDIGPASLALDLLTLKIFGNKNWGLKTLQCPRCQHAGSIEECFSDIRLVLGKKSWRMGFRAFLSDQSIFLHNSECQIVQQLNAHNSATLMASKYYDARLNERAL
jgi:hypothetical protein